MTALPANPLPTLADELLAHLPELLVKHPKGISAALATRVLVTDIASARRAMRSLNSDARAVLMRRLNSREEFLVPLRYREAPGLRCCANCGEFFALRPVRRIALSTKHDYRKCCSRSCSSAWSWTRPGTRERRSAAIRAACATPKARARLQQHNRKRWSRPGEREKLSEWNRKRWADPAIRADLARAIALIQRTPEMRKFYSDLRKEWWKDPVMRQKMTAAMRRSHNTPEAKAKFRELLKARWRNPLTRKKLLAATKRNGAKASDRMRGKKQSPEHVRKRTESTRRTRVKNCGEAI